MKRMGALGERNAFTLIECLPAMAILLVFLSLGTQLVVSGLKLRAGLAVLEQRAEAFPLAWQHFRTSEDRAAVTIKHFSGDWAIYGFPDASWLPESPFGYAAGAQVVLWKREDVPLVVGRVWQIGVKRPDKTGWEWWTSIVDWVINIEGENAEL